MLKNTTSENSPSRQTELETASADNSDLTILSVKNTQIKSTWIKSTKIKSIQENSSDSQTVIQNNKIPDADQDNDHTCIFMLEKTIIKPLNTIIQPLKAESAKAPEKTDTGKSIKIGDTIKNRFVLLEILGVGGMGKVYKALDLRKQEARDNEPYVAIKLLNDEFRHHPEALIALQREARKSQQLAHPNIVNVHDFDRDGQCVFMTMELLEGKSLDRIIADDFPTGMPVEQAVKIINSICDALDYAHQHNIVHADLKPANIFITEKGLAKIFDFGIARAYKKAGVGKQANVSDKTLFDPTVLGALTPTYASLEMLAGEAPQANDDLYSICCVFYELLTGKHPYKRQSAEQAFKQNIPVKKFKGLNKRQAQALYQGLALKGEQRFEDVQNFIQAFNNKATSKVIYLLIMLVLLVVSSAIFYPQFKSGYEDYKNQAFISSIALADNNNSQQVIEKINDYIHSLGISSKAYVLDKIKINYLAAIESQIKKQLDQSSDAKQYQKSYALLDRLKGYYPDSARLNKLATEIDNYKYMELNDLNNQFNDLLESAQYSFFYEPEEAQKLLKLMASIKAIDPEHSLLKDERLILIFQQGINQSLAKKQIPEAEYLLKLAEKIDTNNLALKNLKDKIKLQKNKLDTQNRQQQNNLLSAELLHKKGPLKTINIADLKHQLEAYLSDLQLTDEINARIMQLMTVLKKRLGKRSSWLSEKKQTLARIYLDYSISMREQGRLVESRRFLESARNFDAAVYGLNDEELILTAMENIEQVKYKARQRLAKIKGLKTTLVSQLKAYKMPQAIRTFQSLKRILGRNDPYISGKAKRVIVDTFYKVAQREYNKKHYQKSRKAVKQGLKIVHRHNRLRSLLKKLNRQIALIDKAKQLEFFTNTNQAKVIKK